LPSASTIATPSASTRSADIGVALISELSETPPGSWYTMISRPAGSSTPSGAGTSPSSLVSRRCDTSRSRLSRAISRAVGARSATVRTSTAR
jgi:hypothetical protein